MSTIFAFPLSTKTREKFDAASISLIWNLRIKNRTARIPFSDLGAPGGQSQRGTRAMMKSPVLSLAVILLFCQAVSAAPGSIATEDVTASVSLENFLGAEGIPVKALRFADRDGEHTVLYTITKEKASKTPSADGDICRSQNLNVYRYTKENGTWKRKWRIHDFVQDCPYGLTLGYVPPMLQVTDLDGNGSAEIWSGYVVHCSSDVSPIPMKLIMYEKGTKYAVRGKSRCRVSDNKYEGGSFTPDKAFKKGPKVFLNYAVTLFTENIMPMDLVTLPEEKPSKISRKETAPLPAAGTGTEQKEPAPTPAPSLPAETSTPSRNETVPESLPQAGTGAEQTEVPLPSVPSLPEETTYPIAQ